MAVWPAGGFEQLRHGGSQRIKQRFSALGLGLVGAILGGAACYPGQPDPGLPSASATLHSATINLPRGSYCWSGGGKPTCADSAPVDALLRTGYLEPYRTAGGF